MQSLDKNENLFFNDFQDFLSRKQELLHIQPIVPIEKLPNCHPFSRDEKYIQTLTLDLRELIWEDENPA